MKPRASWIVIAACAALPLLNFPLALLGGRSLFLRDVNTVWSPIADAVVRQVRAGEPPWFDARRAFGQPLFADPRAEVLYPPAWLFWVLPLDRSYAIFAALHLFLAGLGMARLARRLLPDLGEGAQATAAIVYAGGGPLLSLVSHWHHLAAAALLPWVLEAAERDDEGRAATPRLAVLIALQVFAGSPDYSVLTALLAATRGFLASGLRGSRALVQGYAAGLLLAAPQLLPSLAFAADSARAVWPPGPALGPLHPLATLEAALPVQLSTWPLKPDWTASLFRGQAVWMLSHYLGFAAVVAAVIGGSRRGGSARRFALAAMVMGVWFAWGVTSDMGKSFVSGVPVLNGLRFPSKALVAASLGLALLAAGAATAEAASSRRPWRALALTLAVTAGSLVALWSVATAGLAPASPLVLRVTGALAAGLAVAVPSGLATGPWLVPLVIAVDLLTQGAFLNPTTPARLYASRPPLTQKLPEGARLYVSDYSIAPPVGSSRSPGAAAYRLAKAPAGYSRAEATALGATWYLHPPIAGRLGYLGSYDLDILDFYRPRMKAAVTDFVTSRDSVALRRELERASVDYVVTMDPPDLWMAGGLEPFAAEQPFFEAPVRVFRVPAPRPFARLETEQGDPETDAGTVTITERREARIVARAEVIRGTRLVVATSMDRGWRAFVDGREEKVLEAKPDFPAVALTPGAHTVELRYRPPYLMEGVALGLAGLGWIILAARRGSGAA